MRADPRGRALPTWVRRLVRNLVTLGLLLGLYAVVPVPSGPQSTLVAAALFVGGVVTLSGYVLHLHRRSRAGGPASAAVRVESLILVTYAVIVFFALVYLRLAQAPGQFTGLATRIDALYFTMTTLTTVGYGDVHADGQVARLVVTVQLAFDLVFLGLLARIAASLLERPRA